MDYPFENLNAERFQQFCQALLVKEFPKLQSFPVGQRDGGRDAIAYYRGKSSEEFIVFQVKFVRKPLAIQDIHKWLTSIIEEEAPKVNKLIPIGAKEYYLLTNVPGTSYLESGSIDKVQKILNEFIDISAFCWWRDDLSTRLDNLWDLKWSYPEVMTGIDILRYVIQSRISEDGERRTSAIKMYVRNQYETDKEVRFKQIELQNQLLDLFVDIPVELRRRYAEARNKQKHISILRNLQQTLHRNEKEKESDLSEIQRTLFKEPTKEIGAATMLLNPMVQEIIPQVVLEGAPGQGKSTLVQYISQVHRMKILQDNDALANIPKIHKFTSLRIPFKVELRDFAAWINHQNPFFPPDSEDYKQIENWHKSLESFLAAQIKHYSGGLDFSVGDLHAIAKLSSFVLILDGLDEVADISTRHEVVKEVVECVSRLRDSAENLQVIITSRPAAFANSPGFPESQFPHFELGSITRDLIDNYADRWIKARRISDRDSSEVKKILKDKLDQPHLRELARNPMQLAILLSLIHTRGTSLPDKRTALYDSYVDLFFNREAEKHPVVRDHRELLIDIHRYLAWILHSEAEQGNNRGVISSERLQKELKKYLAKEQHDTEIANKLFIGMVERVVALVSRVEGTYEFEVQPLREYFTARHLYETAPYSPAGSESRGTKPDRFDALARNFYWLNVTRFYAGCYSKGELPSLVDSLSDLTNEDGYRFLNHPRLLTMTLLSDWVFAQHRKSVKEAVSLVLDGFGLRLALNNYEGIRRVGSQFILPKNNGKTELIQRCFEILQEDPPFDFALDIIRLINVNDRKSNLLDIWLKHTFENEKARRTKWIEYGLYLGLLSLLTDERLDLLLADDPESNDRYKILFRARRINFLVKTEERTSLIVDLILSRFIAIHPNWRTTSILETV